MRKYNAVGSTILLSFLILWARVASAKTNSIPNIAVPTTSGPTISVTGTAVGWVPTDTITWMLTTETTDKDLMRAKTKSDDQIKFLVELFKERGVPKSDIDAGLVRMKETLGNAGTITITRTVTVRQRDLSKFTQTLETLTTASAGRMLMKYTFDSSKSGEVTRETLSKAVQAAKEKATAMAAVAGAKLGRVLTINEYPPAGWNTPAEEVPVDVPSNVFGADSQKLTMTTYVTFELE